jgi:F5/8 type C domain/Abnormal spindle-like microcephaly-assoc'd, ASPM-SPD-2-Hydin
VPSSLRTRMRLTAVAVLTAGQLTALTVVPSHAAGCLSSGTDASIQAALTGAGAQAVLCPGAVFLLNATVRFTAANQAILTQGLPTDNTRAVLRLNASGVTGAINGGGQNGVTVENLQVDGNIGTLGRGSGDALLEMGNQGSNQVIENNFLHDTRSWSTLHVMEGSVTNDVPSCQGAQVLNNLVMSAGTNVPSGTWADGISLACGTSLVQGNTVIDATDGSIVIFGAPGSTVQNNTVIAQSRVMLGGINMVDYAPVDGNYTGTKVQNNVVDARGALIKVGMAMGPGTWFCEPDTTVNHGATVTGNTLQGNHMGYGYAVRGVSSWTITGNADNSIHAGVAGSMCGGGTQNPQAPAGFQYYAPATSATLQSQFQPVTGNFWGLLNITENVGAAPLVYSAQSSLSFAPVAVGTSYTPQTVTITNTGPATANVSGVSVTGDYSQTNNCGSLATGSSCVVSVTFHPTASGTRTGSLTVSSNAGNGAATVSLTGTGSGGGGTATLAASPTSLTFGSTTVGSAAAAQNVTLTNSGTATAAVSSIAATGDFSQTNNCGSSIAAGASCAVSVVFDPVATGTRSGSLSISTSAANSPTSVSLSGTGASATGTNLAAGRSTSASSNNSPYLSGNVTDADAGTYWESANNAFPQWVQVDLGSAQSVGTVVLKLPPTWGARTQTLSLQGSTDGTTFSTLVGSAGYVFDPSSADTVTVTVPTTSLRYLRVNVTANTGWPAAQLSDLEVFAAAGGSSASLSTSPTSLTFASTTVGATSGAQSVTVHNAGTAAGSVSSVAVTGDFVQTNTCGSSIAAGASCAVSISFRPTATGGRTGSLTVTSSATNSPTTVPLSGTGVLPANTDLAAGKATSESSHTQTYASANVTDGNQNTYWESNNNAFPQWVQVDLAGSQSISRVVLKLPSSWGQRSQTLTLSGSADGTTFTTLKASAAYSFDPSTGDTATLTFPAGSVRYVRATITANTGWPAGQVSSFEVYPS